MRGIYIGKNNKTYTLEFKKKCFCTDAQQEDLTRCFRKVRAPSERIRSANGSSMSRRNIHRIVSIVPH
jgi:hypothetical protein